MLDLIKKYELPCFKYPSVGISDIIEGTFEGNIIHIRIVKFKL